MKKDSSKKKKIPDKRLIVLSIGISIIIMLGFIVYGTFFETQEAKFSLKAAIIDQLSEHSPNATFVEKATNLLMEAGFSVSYYESASVNVPFYKELAKKDYGIIILRAHTAQREGEAIVDLFTSEIYNADAYIWERRNGFLTRGKYLVDPETAPSYFAITPKFIENLEGRFPKSIIIAMGCWSLNSSGMAQAFINKGARAYVGWTEVVLPKDTDHETARFLEMFLVKNKTLANAIAITGDHTYHDPSINITVTSRMQFFPLSVRNLKISDLIAEAKNSQTSTTFNDLEQFRFLTTDVNFKSKDFLTDEVKTTCQLLITF